MDTYIGIYHISPPYSMKMIIKVRVTKPAIIPLDQYMNFPPN